ncbi:hypothetical protein DIPPA_19061 [Diplonema papillatum]|nr:hypothetical protein DIPPA_19061 [Diplonema papillatum]
MGIRPWTLQQAVFAPLSLLLLIGVRDAAAQQPFPGPKLIVEATSATLDALDEARCKATPAACGCAAALSPCTGHDHGDVPGFAEAMAAEIGVDAARLRVRRTGGLPGRTPRQLADQFAQDRRDVDEERLNVTAAAGEEPFGGVAYVENVFGLASDGAQRVGGALRADVAAALGVPEEWVTTLSTPWLSPTGSGTRVVWAVDLSKSVTPYDTVARYSPPFSVPSLVAQLPYAMNGLPSLKHQPAAASNGSISLEGLTLESLTPDEVKLLQDAVAECIAGLVSPLAPASAVSVSGSKDCSECFDFDVDYAAVQAATNLLQPEVDDRIEYALSRDVVIYGIAAVWRSLLRVRTAAVAGHPSVVVLCRGTAAACPSAAPPTSAGYPPMTEAPGLFAFAGSGAADVTEAELAVLHRAVVDDLAAGVNLASADLRAQLQVDPTTGALSAAWLVEVPAARKPAADEALRGYWDGRTEFSFRRLHDAFSGLDGGSGTVAFVDKKDGRKPRVLDAARVAVQVSPPSGVFNATLFKEEVVATLGLSDCGYSPDTAIVAVDDLAFGSGAFVTLTLSFGDCSRAQPARSTLEVTVAGDPTGAVTDGEVRQAVVDTFVCCSAECAASSKCTTLGVLAVDTSNLECAQLVYQSACNNASLCTWMGTACNDTTSNPVASPDSSAEGPKDLAAADEDDSGLSSSEVILIVVVSIVVCLACLMIAYTMRDKRATHGSSSYMGPGFDRQSEPDSDNGLRMRHLYSEQDFDRSSDLQPLPMGALERSHGTSSPSVVPSSGVCDQSPSGGMGNPLGLPSMESFGCLGGDEMEIERIASSASLRSGRGARDAHADDVLPLPALGGAFSQRLSRLVHGRPPSPPQLANNLFSPGTPYELATPSASSIQPVGPTPSRTFQRETSTLSHATSSPGYAVAPSMFDVSASSLSGHLPSSNATPRQPVPIVGRSAGRGSGERALLNFEAALPPSRMNGLPSGGDAGDTSLGELPSLSNSRSSYSSLRDGKDRPASSRVRQDRVSTQTPQAPPATRGLRRGLAETELYL